ncbi:MAG: beta-ketoacyl-ACP reductase [Fimbriimonadaceae bacterium]|nr:beta-ketoacyl-ACP reductase [Fimbriimonadaceae bacterium]
MRFSDQVVLVTGASRGIGAALARAFAQEGGKVACVATTQEGADRTAEEIGGRGYACDVSDSASVDAMVAAVTADLGPVSVLVNNAGITKDGLLMRMKDDDFNRVLDVNLRGAFFTIRAVSRGMLKLQYGRIVNMASVIGQTGAKGQANYAAAKAGIFGLTMSVAKEFGSRGITCNAVAPGFIETDMTAGLTDEFKTFVQQTAPAGRLGTPADISPAVLFLASREAAYITGQTLTVDGGLTL